jgi:NuA3 HAT complex component NTO1
MAPLPSTPRRSGVGRPRKPSSRPRSSGSARLGHGALANTASEPPPKRRRYIPGGPGGGGRYVDEDGTEIPVGGTGPGGYNYVGPRGRIGRENAANGVTPIVYPRRDRSTRTRTVLPRSQQPAMRFSLNLTSAQAAAAAAQSDGYKPREERGWEEFHPDLDIDVKLMVFSAEEVDGIPRSATPAAIQSGTSSINGIHTPNGDMTKPGSTGQLTPGGSINGDIAAILNIPGTPGNKRRPGRPPRDPVAFYAARAAAAGEGPKTPRIAPLQNQHAKERLTLPQPSYRKVDTLSKFEDKAAGLVRYVEKSMANVGYQESDVFIRPERRLIKATDSNLEEDLELAPSKSDAETNLAIGSGGVGRVEYDMDEQDDKWLEAYNAQRKAMDIEPITREIFEITITKIEKEWHALERRIPKPNPKPPQTHRPRSSSAAAVNGEPQVGEEQDSKCAICDDGDCENTNAIVFCDGCDLAVHQECYGVPFIPEGQWLCRRCQLIGRGIPVS